MGSVTHDVSSLKREPQNEVALDRLVSLKAVAVFWTNRSPALSLTGPVFY